MMHCMVSSISDRVAEFRVGGGIVERQKRDPSRGVRANWVREILKTGTLEVQFPAIWSSNFSCSSGNLAGFGNPII